MSRALFQLIASSLCLCGNGRFAVRPNQHLAITQASHYQSDTEQLVEVCWGAFRWRTCRRNSWDTDGAPVRSVNSADPGEFSRRAPPWPLRSLVMIVGENESLAHECASARTLRPRFHLRGPVDDHPLPYFCFLLDSFAVAEQPRVRKIRGLQLRRSSARRCHTARRAELRRYADADRIFN
jgi:hypothetical protein